MFNFQISNHQLSIINNQKIGSYYGGFMYNILLISMLISRLDEHELRKVGFGVLTIYEQG